MVIELGPVLVDEKGEVMMMAVTGWRGILFPFCFWIDGIFCRVARLLSWKPDDKILRQLVETTDGIQVLLEIPLSEKPFDTSYKKWIIKSQIAIPSTTSEYPDNGEKWKRKSKNSWYQTSYPYVKLNHYTESSIKPKIESSGSLLGSSWALSGTVKLDLTFCYFTDLQDVKYAWDFFAIAMTREDYPECMVWETDDLQLVTAKVCKVNKQLDDKLDFLVDMRLTLPNPVIEHHKTGEEWWEVFLPNIYRIACSSMSLVKVGNFYKVEEKVINDYKPSKGFLLLSGDISENLQNMFDDTIMDILV